MASTRDTPSHNRSPSSSSTIIKHPAVPRATTHPTTSAEPSVHYILADSMTSSPASSSSAHIPQRPNKTASRIMTSVRRSFQYSSSPKKQHPDMTKSGMYSTPEERNPFTPSRFRYHDPASTRPTIEQIAMGLHVSRTPHLRPVSKQYPQQRNSAPASQHHLHPYTASHPSTPLPPPPARSSLKKSGTLGTVSTASPTPTPGLSAASLSDTTVTSGAPSTPQSNRSLVSLGARVARFLPSSRSSSAPSSPASSPRASTSDFQPPAKKAVRFSTVVVGSGEVS